MLPFWLKPEASTPPPISLPLQVGVHGLGGTRRAAEPQRGNLVAGRSGLLGRTLVRAAPLAGFRGGGGRCIPLRV